MVDKFRFFLPLFRFCSNIHSDYVSDHSTAILIKNLVSAYLGQMDIFYIIEIVRKFCDFLSKLGKEDFK